jgi:hypothetical protein
MASADHRERLQQCLLFRQSRPDTRGRYSCTPGVRKVEKSRDTYRTVATTMRHQLVIGKANLRR